VVIRIALPRHFCSLSPNPPTRLHEEGNKQQIPLPQPLPAAHRSSGWVPLPLTAGTDQLGILHSPSSLAGTAHSPEKGQGYQEQPQRPQVGDITCPEENDLVFQRQVREVGDSLGPLDECEELLVSCVAYVGDRVICLIKRDIKKKRGEFVNEKSLIITVCTAHSIGSS